jgi:Holliday junction resolvase RusA-like endonuclease
MSWNRSYRQRTVKVKDRLGRPVMDAQGRYKTRSGMFKTEEAEVYQDSVRWLAKIAKPSGFMPAHVIVGYDFVLARDIDCDNVMKMIHDALAEAINLDDKNFYPVVFSKTTGSKTPSVMVHVYDRSAWSVRVDPL